MSSYWKGLEREIEGTPEGRTAIWAALAPNERIAVRCDGQAWPTPVGDLASLAVPNDRWAAKRSGIDLETVVLANSSTLYTALRAGTKADALVLLGQKAQSWINGRPMPVDCPRLVLRDAQPVSCRCPTCEAPHYNVPEGMLFLFRPAGIGSAVLGEGVQYLGDNEPIPLHGTPLLGGGLVWSGPSLWGMRATGHQGIDLETGIQPGNVLVPALQECPGWLLDLVRSKTSVELEQPIKVPRRSAA